MAEFLGTFVPALGHALLHFLWQGALIGLLAALALHTLRHARPQARYAVACLALLACVLAPLVSVIAQLATSFAPMHGGTPVHLPGVASPHRPDVLFGFVPPAAQFDAVLPWVVALWAAGTCVMSLRMALGLAWIRSLRHAPQGPAQAAWQIRLDILVMHFGLRRRVALRLVDTLDSPVSAGWWHPVVLLPAALLTRMPTDLIEALLAHELAHIRRHDYLVNLLQNAVEALLFYHPVTWWLSHRIRIEREQIADQLAAEVACAPRCLALALSELAELHRTRPALHLAQAARGGQLMSRIQQLIRPTRRTHPSARIVFPLLGLAAAFIASYTYAQIRTPAPDATGPGLHAMQVDHTLGTSARETIALVRKDSDDISIWGPNDDMAAIKAAKRGMDGDFLWVYRAGKGYVVTDPSLLARARQAWGETEALSQQMQVLSDQMQIHSNKMQALSGRMEKLSEGHEPSREARAAERAIEDLAQRQESLANQQHELATRQLDAARDEPAKQQRFDHQMQALAAKQEELARLHGRQAAVMETEAKRLEAKQLPMEALSREMELASKPMDALSKRMEALGRQQEKAFDEAEREWRKLISEALANNLAKPAPARVPAQ